MSQPLHFFKLLKTSAILFVAALYCLAPLQKPLMDGFHKLEHTILSTNSDHSHDVAHELEVSHGHDHQLLSFFNNLLQDDSHDDDQPVKEFKLDKHILQQYVLENKTIQFISKENHRYNYSIYSVSITAALPPPKCNFS